MDNRASEGLERDDMSLTVEEVFNMRNYYKNYTDKTIEDTIEIHKSDIEMHQSRINDKREFVKLLETILDERTP